MASHPTTCETHCCGEVERHDGYEHGRDEPLDVVMYFPLDFPASFAEHALMPNALDTIINEASAATAPVVDVPLTAGRMIVDLTPNDSSRPYPRVSFDPVGLFTPGLIHDTLMLMAHECERAHAQARAASANKEKK